MQNRNKDIFQNNKTKEKMWSNGFTYLKHYRICLKGINSVAAISNMFKTKLRSLEKFCTVTGFCRREACLSLQVKFRQSLKNYMKTAPMSPPSVFLCNTALVTSKSVNYPDLDTTLPTWIIDKSQHLIWLWVVSLCERDGNRIFCLGIYCYYRALVFFSLYYLK
jgi:hypothetical protein